MNYRVPWRQGEDEFSIYVTDADGAIIADVRAPDVDPNLTQDGVEVAMREHRTLARLIAKSPEMYRVLRHFTEEVYPSLREPISKELSLFYAFAKAAIEIGMDES